MSLPLTGFLIHATALRFHCSEAIARLLEASIKNFQIVAFEASYQGSAYAGFCLDKTGDAIENGV